MKRTNIRSGSTAFEVFEIIKHEMKRGRNVVVENFGSFKIVKSKPRNRYIITGKIIKVPAKNRVKYTMSPAMKRELNRK